MQDSGDKFPAMFAGSINQNLFRIHQVLGACDCLKVGFSIVQRIVVDVVTISEILPAKPKNFTMHSDRYILSIDHNITDSVYPTAGTIRFRLPMPLG
jgi:hypothetical protein